MDLQRAQSKREGLQLAPATPGFESRGGPDQPKGGTMSDARERKCPECGKPIGKPRSATCGSCTARRSAGKVESLYRQGLSPEEIAKELGWKDNPHLHLAKYGLGGKR